MIHWRGSAQPTAVASPISSTKPIPGKRVHPIRSCSGRIAQPVRLDRDQGERRLSIVDISCPSADLCVAADDDGDVVTSTDPTGGASAWTVTNVDGAKFIMDVSCPSAGLCVGVDNDGDVVTSTDPTGGASAWTVTSVDGGQLLTVCPAPARASASPSTNSATW